MHPDAEVVMRGFAAFAAGDMATMRTLFHDDAKWHTPGNNRFSGDYQGVDAILGVFQTISDAATIDNRPHDILANDDHVVVLVGTTATKNGDSVDYNTVFVFHVDDGKVAEVWAVGTNQDVVDAFWGP